ncbi:hypothetical protein MRX96_034728 [Rhipicephalus microplus]
MKRFAPFQQRDVGGRVTSARRKGVRVARKRCRSPRLTRTVARVANRGPATETLQQQRHVVAAATVCGSRKKSAVEWEGSGRASVDFGRVVHI